MYNATPYFYRQKTRICLIFIYYSDTPILSTILTHKSRKMLRTHACQISKKKKN